MNEEDTPRPPFQTHREFRDAIRAALETAAAQNVQTMCWVDADFMDWPLDTRDTIDALQSWVGARRRLTLLASGFDEMPRRHPRFVAWRRQWAHVVTGRAVALDASEMPTLLLLDKTAGLTVLDRVKGRGHWFADESEVRAAQELVDALLQRSEESFPATTLGL